MFRLNIRKTQKNKVFQYVVYYVCLKYDMIKREYGALEQQLSRPTLNKNMQIGDYLRKDYLRKMHIITSCQSAI